MNIKEFIDTIKEDFSPSETLCSMLSFISTSFGYKTGYAPFRTSPSVGYQFSFSEVTAVTVNEDYVYQLVAYVMLYLSLKHKGGKFRVSHKYKDMARSISLLAMLRGEYESLRGENIMEAHLHQESDLRIVHNRTISTSYPMALASNKNILLINCFITDAPNKMSTIWERSC